MLVDFVAKASAKFNDGDYTSSFITVSMPCVMCVRLFPPIHWQKPIFGAMDLTAFFLTQSISFYPLFILSLLYPIYQISFFFIIFFFGKSSGQIDNFAQQKKNMPLPYYKCFVKFCHKSLIKTPPQHFLFLFLFPRGENNNPLLKNKIKKFSIGNRSIEQRLPPLDRY